MDHSATVAPGQRQRALAASTTAFTVCFAVWTIFSIIGVQIKQNLGLSETEFGLLVGTPILTGSLTRLFLGIWTDQYGGRIVYTLLMLAAAVATFLLSWATTYETFLLAALGVGLAGGSFAVGITYVSRWYPREKQGTALGIFGMGNVGAAVTKFLAPLRRQRLDQITVRDRHYQHSAFWISASEHAVGHPAPGRPATMIWADVAILLLTRTRTIAEGYQQRSGPALTQVKRRRGPGCAASDVVERSCPADPGRSISPAIALEPLGRQLFRRVVRTACSRIAELNGFCTDGRLRN